MGHPTAGDSTGSGSTTADAAVLRAAAADLTGTGTHLSSGGPSLIQTYADIVDGAGEFSGLVSDGADLFCVSWTSVLNLCGETCGLVAGNLGQYVTDLTDVDLLAGPGYKL